MSFFQRIISIALVPIIALIAVQIWYPNLLNDPVGSAQLYAENTPIVHRYLVGTTSSRSETPLVITAFAHWSHYEKVSKVAVALAELGYPITFITGQIFENDVKSLHPNISFVPIQGRPDKFSEEEYEELKAYEPGSAEQGLFMMKKALVGGIPDQHNTLQQVFRAHQDLHGAGKPLISLYDAPFAGHHPVLLGAPGVKPDASLAISCHPLSLDSDDTYPFYMSTLPATGSNATVIHREANRPENMDFATREVSKAYWQQLKELGASTKNDWHIYHAMPALPDYLMTMGVPQFEFHRSDLRPNVHYFGAITSSKKESVSKSELPEWWSDVAAAKQDGKKIVAVSQGSLAVDFNELLIPTLEALKDRNDILVVATTVAMKVEDAKDLVIPSNARVAKFVPYDLLLPQTDVLVNNGGYGAVINSLQIGVPMVLAGTGQDKNLTNVIVDWKQVGVNLGTMRPSINQVREGIMKVLNDEKYKCNALTMSKHFENYEAARVFDGVIQGIVRKWQREQKKANTSHGCDGEI